MTKQFIKLKNTKKNKKSKMPKKKYYSKRISFRNNNKNNNLRKKSIKIRKKKYKTYKNPILKKKGGALSAKTFGLTKDQITDEDLEILKGNCETLAPSPGQPADLWAINYVQDRNLRLRCYSYYLNSIGFFKTLKKRWSSEYQALYNTYTILYNEDKSENSDIIKSKKEYLLACQNFNESKRTILTLATNYLLIFINKKARLTKAIERLKRALTLKIRDLKTLKPRNDEQIKKYSDWVKMNTEDIFKDPELLQKVFNYSALLYLKKINPNYTTADVLSKSKEMNDDLEKIKKKAQTVNQNAIILYNVSYITAKGALYTLNFYLNANNLPNTPVVLPLRFNERDASIIKKDMVSKEFAENKYDILFGFKSNEDDSNLGDLKSEDEENELKKLENSADLRKSESSISSLTDNEDRLSSIEEEDIQNTGSLILDQQNAEQNKKVTEQLQKLLKSDEGDTQEQLDAMSKFIDENPNYDLGVQPAESYGPYDETLYSPTTYLPSNYEPSKTGQLDSLISRLSSVFNQKKKESKPSKDAEGVELSNLSASKDDSTSSSSGLSMYPEDKSTPVTNESSNDLSSSVGEDDSKETSPPPSYDETVKNDPGVVSDDSSSSVPKDDSKDDSKDVPPLTYNESIDFESLQNTTYKGVPPTNSDVYDIINKLSESSSNKTSSGGAAPSTSTLFSGCAPKLCQGFYNKIKESDTGIPVVSSLIEKTELSKLGGVINPENDSVNPTQIGLIMSKPQLDEAFKLYTKDKWFENLRGNQEKKCLLCLYRGFIKLCQLRDITLDSELQGDVPNNYKVDRTTPDDDVPTNAIPADGIPTADAVPTDVVPADAVPTDAVPADVVPADAENRTRRPRQIGELSSLASIGNSNGTNPPIEILTDNRNKDKFIWIKISAAPDCLKGIIDNNYDSAEQTIKTLITADEDQSSQPSSSSTSGPPPVPIATPV